MILFASRKVLFLRLRIIIYRWPWMIPYTLHWSQRFISCCLKFWTWTRSICSIWHCEPALQNMNLSVSFWIWLLNDAYFDLDIWRPCEICHFWQSLFFHGHFLTSQNLLSMVTLQEVHFLTISPLKNCIKTLSSTG